MPRTECLLHGLDMLYQSILLLHPEQMASRKEYTVINIINLCIMLSPPTHASSSSAKPRDYPALRVKHLFSITFLPPSTHPRPLNPHSHMCNHITQSTKSIS